MTCIAPLLLFFSLLFFGESLDCGDGYTCPDYATCCRLLDGIWGCCPMENAVCCEDQVHCCPSNMRCDGNVSQCVGSDGGTSPLRRKFEALRDEVICPDMKSKCPSGTTCCKLLSDKYGCCPAENATCCPDHMHCCPQGYKCDTTGQRCIETETFKVISSLRKHKATPIREKPAIHMIHPNEDSFEDDTAFVKCGYGKSCPAFSTCCEVTHDGRIRHMCCPIQNGVCCESTCCPFGYHCRPKGGCEKHATRHSFFDF
ncbi:hypothetical protein KIN20_016778 [Parelaphostrongylus tenuis]|uniref:Granulins domain-containing protein n=1 Tax=Parelaphostrongylus tenuis TaxID=148309 RepID=A0AAD5QQ51_PARTN|nr:hypothetical protein KIN20_016778 [Parelaphostrongylus tenuis]